MALIEQGTKLGEAKSVHGSDIVPPQVPDWATYGTPPEHYDSELHQRIDHGPWIYFKDRPIHQTADTTNPKNSKVNEVFTCPVKDCTGNSQLFEVQIVQLKTTKAQQIQCKTCKFSFYVTEARAF